MAKKNKIGKLVPIILWERDIDNDGYPKARKRELKDKLATSIECLRSGHPMDQDIRDAIASVIEDFAFPKRGPKGSKVSFVAVGQRAEELREEGMKVCKIDETLSEEFGRGGKDEYSTIKRMRLKYERAMDEIQKFNNERNEPKNSTTK